MVKVNFRHIVTMVIAAFLVAGFLHFSSPKIPDMDSFYHFRHASLLRDNPFNTDLPWIQNSVIREKAADLWYGTHLLLIPFAVIENSTTGIKLGGVFLTSLLLIAYFIVVKRHNISMPFLWPFLFLLAAPHSLYMLLMTRPHVLSLAAGLLIFSYLIKGTWLRVGLASVALTFFHVSQFWIGFGLAFLVLGMRIFQKIFIDRSWGLELSKFTAVFGGMLIGALLRPHPLANLELTYIQIFRLFQEKARLPLLFGKEIAPISLNITFDITFLFSILWILAIILAIWSLYKLREQIGRLSAEIQLLLVGSGILSLVFFLMSILIARRAYALWIGFGVLFIAGVYNFLIGKKFNRNIFLTIIFVIFLMMIPYTLHQEGVIFASDAAPPDYLRDAAMWLSENSEEGDVVFNMHWDNFAPLFFWNQKNHYVAGIDPIYQYVYNPVLYWEFHFLSKDITSEFTCGDVNCDSGGRKETYKALKEDFNAKYILIEQRRNPNFYDFLERDSRFKKEFSSENNRETVFSIK